MLKTILLWLLISCLALNAMGLIIDISWSKKTDPNVPSYFGLKLETLSNFPFWLLASLLLFVFNGIFLLKNAFISAGIRDRTGWVDFPHVRMLGSNLVFIFILIVLYLIIAIIRVHPITRLG